MTTKQLFKESWVTLKHVWISLVKVNLITMGMALFIVLVNLLLALLVFGFSTDTFQNIATNPLQMIVVGLLIVVDVVAIFLISSIAQIANILIVDSNGKLPIREAINKSVPLIVPAIFTGVISAFLLVGSLFAFVLPYIIVALLFSFVTYEVVLKGKKYTAAIRRSVTVVSENFWDFVTKIIVATGVSLIVTSIIPSILRRILPEAQSTISLLSAFINIFLGLYFMVFYLTLYRQLEKATDRKDDKDITWIWIVSIVGWLIFALIGVTLFRIATSREFIDTFSKGFL